MRDVSGMNPGSRNRARGELIVHGPSVLIVKSSAVSMSWVPMGQLRLTANDATADYRAVLLQDNQKMADSQPWVERCATAQCRKWRRPVSIMAMPCSLQAAITALP